MTKQKIYKREYAHELQKIAKADLESAEILFAPRRGRKENVLFHVGQCVEKSLKAILCWSGIPLPITHDLQVLIDRIPDQEQPPALDFIDGLTEFSTIRRYEEGKSEISDEEIIASIKTAKKILTWVDEKLK